MALLVVVLLGGMFSMLPLTGIVDEGPHGGQILSWIRGEAPRDFGITTPLWLHRVLATLGAWSGAESYAGLRPWISLIALIGWWQAWRLACAIHPAPGLARIRLLQFVCLPIALPYTFLIYTDLPALAALLAAFAAAQRGKHGAATVWFGVAMLVRQQNIAWAFVAGTRRAWTRWRESRSLRALISDPAMWLYALLGLGFLAFVIGNGGVALGEDRHRHMPGLHRGNVQALWLLASVLLLPLVIVRWRDALNALRMRRWEGWMALAVTLLFLHSLPVEHPYNQFQPEVFLRNRVLLWLQEPLHRWWLAPPLLFSVAALCTLRLRGGWSGWIALGSVLVLAPAELIEHRYTIPVFALVLLLREPLAPRVEWCLLAWLGALGALALFVHANLITLF